MAADCPDPTWGCYPVAGGETYCLQNPDLIDACSLDSDCADGHFCSVQLSFEGGKVVTRCTAGTSGGAGGSSCTAGTQCKLGICWNGPGQGGACAGVCTADEDCSSGLICIPVPFELPGPALDATLLCYDGRRCASSFECVLHQGLGAECAPSWRLDAVVPLCQAPPGAGPGGAAGTACTENAECAGSRCLQGTCFDPVPAGGYCSVCGPDEAWCDALCLSGACVDGHCTVVCTDDSQCALVGADRVCVPWAFAVSDGTDHVPICVAGPRCSSAAGCPTGTLCAGMDEGPTWATVCRPLPFVPGGAANGQPCAQDLDCGSGRCDLGACQPREATGGPCARSQDCLTSLCAGAGQCAAPCGDDVDCGGGSCALDLVPTASNPQATVTVCVP